MRIYGAEYLGGTVYGNNPITGEKLNPAEFGGACNLGSLFLHNFVENPFTKNAHIDWELLKNTIYTATRMLDNIIDINNFPNKIYENYQKDFRTIGLGFTGLADMLVMLNLKYDSQEARNFVDNLVEFIAFNTYKASIELAKERGSFPFLDREKFVNSGYILKHCKSSDSSWREIKEDILKYGIRNAKLMSVAPVGTLSLTFGNNCSSGLEPIFSLEYERKVKIGGQTEDKTKIVKMQDYAYGLWLSKKDDIDNIVTKDVFVTALEMTVDSHINMLGTVAKHIDMSCSKTINVPESYSFEETKNIYMKCHDMGIKGCTIFRPNALRQGVLLSGKDNKPKEPVSKNDTFELKRGMIIKADDNSVGKKRTLHTGCGTLHCEAFFDQDTGELLETYLSKGSTGGCVDADTEYFNGHEWKKISEYKRGSKEKVLQYNENGVAELVEPINYIVNDNVSTLKHFTSNYGLDMVLSEDHRMFLYKNYTKYSMGVRNKLTTEIVTVKDYLSRTKSKERHVPTTFSFKANGIPLKDECIRLLVAIYADGTFDGNKIVVNLKKERKKSRLRSLLLSCDIGWTERNIHNTEHTYFYIHPVPSIANWFTDKKFTSKWYDCTDDQLRLIIDECVHWDGSIGTGGRLGEYYSSKKEEIDFIQFALARLGFRGSISSNDSKTTNDGKTSTNKSYRIRWTKQNVHNLEYAKISDYQTIDGHSYCFTVPSGLLVLRRNNKIFITGNCNNFMIGLSRMISLAARGGIDIYSIVDQLQSSGTCPSYAVRKATKHDTSKGSSCPVAIGNALIDMYKEMQSEINEDYSEVIPCNNTCTKEEVKTVANKVSHKCPECGEEIVFEGGCNSCKACGWSSCN